MCTDHFTTVTHHVNRERVFRAFQKSSFSSVSHSYSVEQALQTGHGFYKGLPGQKGYGICGLFGSLAHQFIPLVKPVARAIRRCVLSAGAMLAHKYADGKSVSKSATSGVRELGHSDKKRRPGDQPTTPKKRRRRMQDYLSQNDRSPYKRT